MHLHTWRLLCAGRVVKPDFPWLWVTARQGTSRHNTGTGIAGLGGLRQTGRNLCTLHPIVQQRLKFGHEQQKQGPPLRA